MSPVAAPRRTITLAAATDLASAWDRVEEVIRQTPHAWGVWISWALVPVLPYRAWVKLTYRPPGHKRNRTDRIEGEGPTLAAALDELADALEERLRETGGYRRALS